MEHHFQVLLSEHVRALQHQRTGVRGLTNVILTHGVNMDKQTMEDVLIPHLMFYQLSQYQFRDIEIDTRDNLGRPIPFPGGVVTATLYFRGDRFCKMRRDKKPIPPSQWVQVGGGGAI